MLVQHGGRAPLLRLAVASALLAATGAALPALAPDPVGTARSLGALQQVADTLGADAVVLRVAGLLLWLVWAWGALGLVLTAAGALPGCAGALARLLARLLVPAAARRAAALALGVGIGLNGAGAALAAPAPVSAGATAVAPDWPAGPAAAPAAPDWPSSGDPATTPHVVVPGDCLWRIAEVSLSGDGARPTDGEVARAVQDWWQVNEHVIGDDPDLLRPGQVLQAPGTKTGVGR